MEESESTFMVADDLNELENRVSPEEVVEECTIEELLISGVQARPPLWDSRLPLKERSKVIRDQMWQKTFVESGENPSYSIDFLMKKWRTLRDTFVRIKGEYTPSGAPATKKKKWEYFDVMKFLSDTLKHQATISNLVLSPSASTSRTSTPLTSSDLPTQTGKTQDQNKTKEKSTKIESAILDALVKVSTPLEVTNTNPCVCVAASVNPICKTISQLLEKMPQGPRTQLEIKLLQVAYDGSKNYLE